MATRRVGLAASELQVFPEPLRLRAAHGDLRALRVLHPEDVIPAEPGDYLLDLVDVDQVRPVYPPEHLGVEPCLQIVQGPVVRAAGHMARYYVNRLVRQRGIDDVVGLDQEKSFTNFHSHLVPPDLTPGHHLYDAFELIVQRGGPRGAIRAQAPPGPLEGLFQAPGVDRLQQVIDRVHLEGFDGVLVKSRHKYECRRLIIALEQAPGHLEAGETGHLDVEEYEIGLVPLHGRDRLESVARLGDHFEGPELSELVAQLLARQLLVVYDYDLHAVICSATVSSGISMRARVPFPGSLASVSW